MLNWAGTQLKGFFVKKLTFGVIGVVLAAGAFAESLPVFNSYMTPPFVLSGDAGLAADTTAYLNKKLAGKHELKLSNIPRARLALLALNNDAFKGAVLFMNPMFVADNEKTKYAWTDTLMKDSNTVVSPAGHKFNYTDVESFTGKTFIGVAGNRYAGLEEKFGKSVKREDASNEEASLTKLVGGSGDVTLLAKSIATYFSLQPGFSGKFTMDAKPYSTFTRHILVSKSTPELASELSRIVKEAEKDPEWKSILAKYGM